MLGASQLLLESNCEQRDITALNQACFGSRLGGHICLYATVGHCTHQIFEGEIIAHIIHGFNSMTVPIR